MIAITPKRGVQGPHSSLAVIIGISGKFIDLPI